MTKNTLLKSLILSTAAAAAAVFVVGRNTQTVQASESIDDSWDIAGHGQFEYPLAGNCPNQVCKFIGGGYKCDDVESAQLCTNYGSTCATSVCH